MPRSRQTTSRRSSPLLPGVRQAGVQLRTDASGKARIASLQGAYFLATGVWPLVSRRTFEQAAAAVGIREFAERELGQLAHDWRAPARLQGLRGRHRLAEPVHGSKPLLNQACASAAARQLQNGTPSS